MSSAGACASVGIYVVSLSDCYTSGDHNREIATEGKQIKEHRRAERKDAETRANPKPKKIEQHLIQLCPSQAQDRQQITPVTTS
jgi:hypothetical protein